MKYFLEAKDVMTLMQVSRVFYQLATQDAHLWKRFVFAAKGGDFSFKKNWRRTYFLARDRVDDRPLPIIEAPGFYSPRMVRRAYRATVDLNTFVSAQPYGVPRRSGLSVEDFLKEYVNEEKVVVEVDFFFFLLLDRFAVPRKPVIITDVCTNWPAYKEWSKEGLGAALTKMD